MTTHPDCPPDLVGVDYTDVYRKQTERDQCGWNNCDTSSPHGRFCDQHRRWHAQRQLHQLDQIERGA